MLSDIGFSVMFHFKLYAKLLGLLNKSKAAVDLVLINFTASCDESMICKIFWKVSRLLLDEKHPFSGRIHKLYA